MSLAAGLAIPEPCHLCGSPAPDDLHRIWLCEGLDRGKQAITETQHLATRASAESQELACFSLRGVPPEKWLSVPPPALDNEDLELHIFQLQAEDLADTIDLERGRFAGASVYTDGSGGEDSACTKVQRCAWAMSILKAALGEPTEFLGGWGLALAGTPQTVPRSELAAVGRFRGEPARRQICWGYCCSVPLAR